MKKENIFKAKEMKDFVFLLFKGKNWLGNML